MYFESVFIKPNNFYIIIYKMNTTKKFMKIAFLLASKLGRPLGAQGAKPPDRAQSPEW